MDHELDLDRPYRTRPHQHQPPHPPPPASDFFAAAAQMKLEPGEATGDTHMFVYDDYNSASHLPQHQQMHQFPSFQHNQHYQHHHYQHYQNQPGLQPGHNGSMGQLGPLGPPGPTGQPAHSANSSQHFHLSQNPNPLQYHSSHPGDIYDYSVPGTDVDELRLVALNSLKFPIERAAQQVRDDEDGPLSEQSRRVFGMGWLMRNCKLDLDANVPRNRVYASYIETCSQLGLRPLPHSIFGKLVRAAFPGLKTRRLGMRGQSKYHYCGLQLADDDTSPHGTPPEPSPSSASSGAKVSADPSSATSSGISSGPPSSATGPSTGLSNGLLGGMSSTLSNPTNANGDPKLVEADPAELQLPPLADYVSAFDGKSNSDDSDVPRDGMLRALSGLYQTQCRTFLELFESMDVKRLLETVRGFQNHLSAPLRQMFHDDPALSEWAGACDSRVYCRAIVGLSQAALQPMPETVSERVRTLMLHLPHEIRVCSARVAESLMAAKLAAAAPFVDLLGRFLRVNKSSATATDMLRSASNIAVMRADWLNAVTPYATRAAPSCCRPDEIWRRLHNDVPNLLANPGPPDSTATTEPLQPWVQYISQTCEQYSTAALEHVQLGISSVASAALRDLTMANSQAFGHWWLLRCWIDEWLCWTSELTAFMRIAHAATAA